MKKEWVSLFWAAVIFGTYLFSIWIHKVSAVVEKLQ